MSKWEYLDDEYETEPSFTPIRKNMLPEGSLTDHRRMVTPNRNGAYKRARELSRRIKEYL